MDAGIPRTTITGRIESSFLFPVFPGVYSVGRSELTLEGLWMASVLAAGPGAVLAGRSAATAWGFMEHHHSVDIARTAGGRGKASLLPLVGTRTWPYTFIRRVRELPASDTCVLNGIPITSVPRAVLDTAGLVPTDDFIRAFIEADRLQLLVDDDLVRLAGNCRGRMGAALFRRMTLRRIPDIGRAKSILEGILLELRMAGGIQPPEVNVKILGKEMDFVWRDRAVIVEVDGWEFHRGQEAFEEDALENNRLRSEGWTVLRFTWRMVSERPGEVGKMVRKTLAEAEVLGK